MPNPSRIALVLTSSSSSSARERPVGERCVYPWAPTSWPGGDDVAHPVGVHLGDTAGHEERRRQATAVEQAKQLGHADVGAVRAHREQPRLRRGVRVARQPHLLGIEVEREGDGAAGARRPGHGATAAAARPMTRSSSSHGYGSISPFVSFTEATDQPVHGAVELELIVRVEDHGIDLPPVVGRPRTSRADRPRGIDDAPLRLRAGRCTTMNVALDFVRIPLDLAGRPTRPGGRPASSRACRSSSSCAFLSSQASPSCSTAGHRRTRRAGSGRASCMAQTSHCHARSIAVAYAVAGPNSRRGPAVTRATADHWVGLLAFTTCPEIPVATAIFRLRLHLRDNDRDDRTHLVGFPTRRSVPLTCTVLPSSSRQSS